MLLSYMNRLFFKFKREFAKISGDCKSTGWWISISYDLFDTLHCLENFVDQLFGIVAFGSATGNHE